MPLSTPFLLLAGPYSSHMTWPPCQHSGRRGSLCTSSAHPTYRPPLLQPPPTSLSSFTGPLSQSWPPDSKFQWPLCWVLSTRMRPNSALWMWILLRGCLKHLWSGGFGIRNSFLCSANSGDASPLLYTVDEKAVGRARG